MLAYTIKAERDDNETFLITCQELPEVTSFAETEDDIPLRAADAIEEAIAARIADREMVPEGARVLRPKRGALLVPVSPLTTMKAALHNEMLASHINKAELARRLNWHGPQVDRVLDVRHTSRIDQIEAALAVLGLRVHVEVTRDDAGNGRYAA